MKCDETGAGPTNDRPWDSAVSTPPSLESPPPRKNARWSRWPLLALIVAAFFAMGHVAGAFQKEQDLLRSKRISAETFEVRGPDNKQRASLSTSPRGEALLSFYDQDGRSRLLLGIGAKGSPTISFLDEAQAQRMGLSLDSQDGTPQIVLFDVDKEPALHLGVTKGFGPDIFVGRRGQGRVSIFLTKEGAPSVQILDQKGNPRISVGVFNDGPSMSLLGDNRVVRATWRLLPDGSPSFLLYDRQSRQRLIVATDEQGKPSIRFTDPDKNDSREIK
jgi:hypothetical protein